MIVGMAVWMRYRGHGVTVIDGGCPLMFDLTADFGHKVMRFAFTRSGKVPKTV